MAASNKNILFILFLISIFLPVHFYGKSNGGNKMQEQTNSEIIIEINRSTNPWAGFTSSAEEEDASKNVQALPVDGTNYAVLPNLVRYNKSNLILIGRNEKLRKVAVNDQVFSDLKRGDAARKADEKDQNIGFIKEKALGLYNPRELVQFLLESHVIITYWHIESKLTLKDEEENRDLYKARFTGNHIYFTNKKNVSPLDFTVSIDKKTGEIRVVAQ